MELLLAWLGHRVAWQAAQSSYCTEVMLSYMETLPWVNWHHKMNQRYRTLTETVLTYPISMKNAPFRYSLMVLPHTSPLCLITKNLD